METNRPFFSVVVPTKNRPNYLRESIQSVLNQNFDDFELIVSDNLNETPTQEVVDEFMGHPKFSSYRTSEELNMINHWEFATKKATGKYVILLADRKLLFQNALTTAWKHISNHPELNAFSFGVQMFNESTRVRYSDDFQGTFEKLNCAELTQNFLRTNYFQNESFDYKFPKTLNGCYKNSYAAEIRDRFGSYFNLAGVTTPDYSSLFLNLALNESLGYISEPMILTQGEQVSNGRNFGKGKFEAYMKSLGLDNPYQRVPVKAPFIYNLLISDWLVIQEHTNQNPVEIDWVNFYATCKYELQRKISSEAPDSSVTSVFSNALEDAIGRLDIKTKEKIENRFQKYEQTRIAWNSGKPKTSASDYAQAAVRKVKKVFIPHFGTGEKFNNALEAANHKIKP